MTWGLSSQTRPKSSLGVGLREETRKRDSYDEEGSRFGKSRRRSFGGAGGGGVDWKTMSLFSSHLDLGSVLLILPTHPG